MGRERHEKKLDVSFHIQEVIRDKYICQERGIIEFIYSENSCDIVSLLYCKERNKGEILLEKWEIGTHSRSSFVNIEKYLEVWYKNKDKKRLFKWIKYDIELFEKYLKLFCELVDIVYWGICRCSDLHDFISDYSEAFFWEKSLSEKRMNLKKSLLGIGKLSFIIYEVFDTFLVIEDHLSIVC